MSLRRRFFYNIEGFAPPLKEDAIRLGGYGFSAYLDRELAKKTLQKPLPKKSPIIGYAREIIRRYGFSDIQLKHFEPYLFVNDEKGLTSLVQVFNVPGDACEIGADYNEMEELRREDDEYTKNWVEYHPHNVDNLQQASALLSIFTFWVNTMASVLDFNLIKE